MLMIPVLLFLYTNQKFGRYGVQMICVTGVLAFIIYTLMGKIDFLSTVLGRLQGANNLAELTTGRSKIWQDYLENFFEEPIYVLIGRGVNARLIKGKGSHNTYIELIYYLGIIGTFFGLQMGYLFLKIDHFRTLFGLFI